MNREEFLALPWEQQNALVATKVMGLTVRTFAAWTPGCPGGTTLVTVDPEGAAAFLPDYVGDVGDAWQVFEAVDAFHKSLQSNPDEQNRWLCSFLTGGVEPIEAFGPTAPLAICLASLKAVGVVA